jgi:glycogen operon protein
VSYNQKHNLMNGEDNRDGAGENYSWNCGVEGPTDDAEILDLRRRQAKNFIVTLLISQGVPMLLAGDEFLRTQQGNNNAYCQDNEVSWVDWGLADRNADFLRFVREMIALRKRHPALRRREFFRWPDPTGSYEPEIAWHGVKPHAPDFGPLSRSIAFSLDGSQTSREPDRDLYVALSAWREPLLFTVPRSRSGRRWRRVVDTALASPLDIIGPDEGPVVPFGSVYPVEAFAAVVLIGE